MIGEAARGVRGDGIPPDQQLFGMVVARGGERAVTASWALGRAEIIEWLAEDGDPVSEGQPLVRVQPPTGASPGSDRGKESA